MKRVSIIILCMLTILLGAYCQDYYWYKGEQMHLQRGNQRYIIYEDNNAQGFDSLRIVETGDVTTSKHENFKWAIVDQKAEITAKNVVYQTQSFLRAGTRHNIFVTHRFSVKLKSVQDLAILQEYATKYNLQIEKDKYLSLWYILTCNINTPYNAIELANIFYETGLFAVSEPEFTHAVQFDCVNDYYFAYQWNLENTGQHGTSYSGIDINYCEAHAITTGDSSVIIGVYDLGVDLTHPEINLYSFSYDVNTQSSPSTIYTTYNGNNYHGTACAGIIGAKTNNTNGIAGIAPDCPIMSISFYNTTTTNIKNAFIVAANNGCSVISNSWSLSSPCAYVDAGISHALSQGRNGKGCIVVFSAGNDGRDSVNYPANSNDSILVVGAMSPCGERCDSNSCEGEYWWGSNFGNKVDVVAPGVKIRTTDLVGEAGRTPTNYMVDFNGTSSACPHAAAIAGLILSVNSFLTQKEVVDIIESKAQKIGGYSYTPQSGRPNGNWNYEMGYGLVDAYASVVEARNRYPFISGAVSLCNTGSYHIHNMPSNATVNWSYETDIQQVGNYPIITISNTLSPTITVQRGSYYDLNSLLPQLYAGYVTLKATVTCNGVTKVFTKELFMHEDVTPTIPASQRGKIGNNETRTFYVDNMNGVNYQNVKWRIALPLSTDTITHYGYSWSITPTISTVNPGLMNIRLYNLENCDLSSFTSYNVRIDYRTPIDPFDPLLLFPNPVTTGTISIQVIDKNYSTRGHNDEETVERPDIEYTLELWDNDSRSVRSINSTIRGEKDVVTMDVSNLANGIYFLIMKVKNEIITTEKMIINH